MNMNTFSFRKIVASAFLFASIFFFGGIGQGSISTQAQTCSGTCVSGACPTGSSASGTCPTSGLTCCVASTPPPTSSSGGTTINFTNPLAFDTVEDVLDSVLSTLQGIIVTLSLVFIVIGAVLYITSAGDEGRIKTAKAAITASMIGLALGIAAPSFLKEISGVLGWTSLPSAASGALTLSEIAMNVLDFLLAIVGVLAIIMLVIGGMMYLTAAGSEDQIDTGKKIIKFSIIGIAVSLAALVIVSQIAAFF